jgi:protease-4
MATTCILLTIACITDAAAAEDPMSLHSGFTLTSVAYNDDATAALANPAGLALDRGFTAFLGLSHDRDQLDGLQAALAPGNIAFSYLHLLDRAGQPEMSSVGLSFAQDLSHGIYAGIRSNWHRARPGSIGSAWTFDAGLLYRPIRWVSVGALASNLNRPEWLGETLEAELDLGMAVRPLTERVTLAADISLYDWGMDDSVTWAAGAQLEPLPGLLLQGGRDHQENYWVGIGINLATMGSRYVSRAPKRGSFDQHTYGMTFNAARKATVFERRNRIAEIDLDGLIEEHPVGFSLFGTSGTSVHSILKQLDNVRRDPQVRGALLDIHDTRVGIASLQEISDAIMKIRNEGKAVVAYLAEGAEYSELYLAANCDEVIANPASYFVFVGTYTDVPLLKGLGEKVGIDLETYEAGDAKLMEAMMEHDSLNALGRQVYQFMVNSVHDALVQKLAQRRGLDVTAIDQALDQGLFLVDDAQRYGFIDTTGTRKEAVARTAHLCGMQGDPEKAKTISVEGRHYYDNRWTSPPQVAVILASGDISDGKSGVDRLMGGRHIGSETLVRQLERLRNDRRVKAIVIRVDSPGGSGTASELIWQEIEKTKEKKPVIVSLANIAASGGYYISCGADRIFADPASMVGAIHCLFIKPTFEDLYQRIGLKFETFRSGPMADFGSTVRHLTSDEREILARVTDDFYLHYRKRVQQGRKLYGDDLEEVSKGQLFTGTQALEYGLIDELGGLDRAIEAASELAELTEEPEVVYYKPTLPFLSLKIGGPDGVSLGLRDLLDPPDMQDYLLRYPIDGASLVID